MLPRSFVQMAVIIQLINSVLGEHTDGPQPLNGTYDRCEENDFVCIGITRPLSFRVAKSEDCVRKKNCLAFALIHHLGDTLNFYLLTEHRRTELIKFNIFHGNASAGLSIEMNCTDFEGHRPPLQMNVRGHRLPFSTIPESGLPGNLLSLADRYCVWSSEASFFVNDIFRNEASHLYFDFIKRTYDVSLQFKRLPDANATAEPLPILRLPAVRLVKSEEPTVHFIKILLSLNLVCLIALFAATIFQEG